MGCLLLSIVDKQDVEVKDEDMLPPSPSDKNKLKKVKLENDDISKIKGSNIITSSFTKGSIVNLSSPFKENVYKESCTNSPFYSKIMYQSSPLLKNMDWYNAPSPGPNYGGNEQGPDTQNLASPLLDMKTKFELGTPFKSPINQA